MHSWVCLVAMCDDACVLVQTADVVDVCEREEGRKREGWSASANMGTAKHSTMTIELRVVIIKL
jgi:Na+/melibiose symporter-like transporter